jgi:hypothetical protein
VLEITLIDSLPAGEQLNVTFGDASQGSPGFTVQTFIEEASPLSVRLRAAPDAAWVELARPAVRIGGTSPHQIVLTAPSRVAKGRSFDMHLRVEDIWGNPAQLEAPVSFDEPVACEVRVPASGWTRVAMTLSESGFHRLGAHVAGTNILRAISNPIEVVDDAVVEQLYWGDLHAQSVIGCGARSIAARDKAQGWQTPRRGLRLPAYGSFYGSRAAHNLPTRNRRRPTGVFDDDCSIAVVGGWTGGHCCCCWPAGGRDHNEPRYMTSVFPRSRM